ncbi:MAG: VWA domain-containing protein [Spirochaetes bacterium]|nr:VWA domain-containing protein [Spirochaetota bacterium]
MRTKSIGAIISFLSLILVFQFTVATGSSHAAKNKDVIIVLDTSLSMVGQAQGRDIFDRAKSSIRDYIEQVRDGDRITFATFDTDVRIFPSVIVDDQNDRDILKKYITMTEATGLWTNTYQMIIKILEFTNKVEKENERPTDIVIMTDGIDDPPPGGKGLDFEEFAKKYGKKQDLWVYVISFTSIANSDAARKMEKDLGLVSDAVSIIETDDPEKGKDQLIEEGKKRESGRCSILVPLIIAVAVIILILLILFLVRRYTELKASGKLEFWNNEIIEPYTQHFDLARRPVREAFIGKGLGCVLNIRDINIKKPFSIKAVRHEGAIRMALIDNENARADMVNRQPDGFLADGDMFKVGNYTFKYFQT